MDYTLAVFKSRFATLNFARTLRNQNVPVAIISTPQSIGRSCGISVKFLSDFFPMVTTILHGRGFGESFVGFFTVSTDGRRFIKL